MTARKRPTPITHGPAPVRNDSRALAVAQATERAFRGLRMEGRATEGRQLAALPQRDEWLAEATKDGEFPFLCNGDESYPVMISGLQKPASLSPGGQPLFEVHAKLPLDTAGIAAAAADVLEAVAE